ncbi:MAG TPA: PDZ domain-containing protein [Candidatus Aquilonibacter sp.]|nr:PDZ domain-containing protein [Candidatus Aquilonibacter sp.]
MKILPRSAAFAALCLLVGSFALLRGQATPSPAAPPKFAYGGDAAELAAQFTDNLVFLSARVNLSDPSLFLLDTTAAASSIAPDRAAEIGRANAASPVLNLTGLDFPVPSLPSLPDPDFGARYGLEYQGTIGRDFLSSLVVQVDYARETVRAYAPVSYKYSGKGIILPMAQSSGAPLVSLRFALEKSKERTANFIVDTSLDASIVFDQKFLAAHHMNGDAGKTIPAVDPFTGAAGAEIGRLRDLEFGKTSVGDVLGTYSKHAFPNAGVPIAGAIGAQLLRRFTVVFDFPHHQLIFDPNSHFGDPDEEDKSGMMIVAQGSNYKTFAVAAVQPNSPAAQAGIKTGDIIAGVDTDPAADLSLLVVRNLFCQVGHKYKVVLQRGDQTKEITLQMRRYF